MFKKLFKFGKKKQEEANDNEVVNEHDTAIEENNDNVNESKQEDIAVSNEDVVEEKVENEETKDLENSDVSETIESVEEKTSRTATASGHAVFRNCISDPDLVLAVQFL